MKKLFINGRWVYWVAGTGLLGIGIFVIVNNHNTQKIYDQIKKNLKNEDDGLPNGSKGNYEDLYQWGPLANPGKATQAAAKAGQIATISIGTPAKPGKARIYAKNIYDSISRVEALSNPDKIVDTFRLLKNKADVAKLAEAWSIMYGGSSLLTMLKDVLNPTIGKNRLPELYEIMSRLS